MVHPEYYIKVIEKTQFQGIAHLEKRAGMVSTITPLMEDDFG